MKPRNDKRISTSFSLADLDALLNGGPHEYDALDKLDKLRTKLRARVALAKLAEART